jgi:hypothetical protein
MLEAMGSMGMIWDSHSPRFQQGDLVGDGDGGLFKLHAISYEDSDGYKTKKPAGVRSFGTEVPSEAWRVLLSNDMEQSC